ncbi:FecR family protein [Pseudomonas aeruginosa]|uniref:FecR family protein n=1 Tax=Pseudomonas aeruginosa TaxID=287 RepID=UPI000F7D97DC|nr:FecR family protein [Pseudomonas aeruginosa]RTB44109.1 FecR family protein [Pseudomonas aeruginosa]
MTRSDTSAQHDDTSLDDIEQEAALWFTRRMDASWTDEDEAELQEWLNRSPAHRDAWHRTEQMWGELAGMKKIAAGSLGVPPPSKVVSRAAADQAPAARPAHAPCKRAGRPGVGTFLARLLFPLAGLYAAVWLAIGNPIVAWQADYRTGNGEVRSFVLSDGSTVELGANSALSVDYTSQERRLKLLQGEAFFDVAPVSGTGVDTGGTPESRPFLVAADQGSTQALGTQFIVAYHRESITVTGVEHQVEVASTVAQSYPARAVLSPGQAIDYGDSGLGQVRSVSIEQATAWRRGLMIFDQTPLVDVVAQLRQYHGSTIIIGSASLEQRRISGAFPARDLTLALQSISDELNIRIVRLPLITILY